MIYADYNGSAPLLPEVRQYLQQRLVDGPFANPNAIHSLGEKILKGMEKCREICADHLGAQAHQIIFTSGSSEGISTIFHSVLSDQSDQSDQSDVLQKIIIISSIEHSAVLNVAKFYEKKGFILKSLPVDGNGVINLSLLKDWINLYREKIALVSIMSANNETGVIQPLDEIQQACSQFQIPYFSDTTQSIGKSDFHFNQSGIDYAVCSGHKLGALTGSGILLVKNPSTLIPLIWGGGQEKGYRGGTQHYLGNETLAIALMQFDQNKHRLQEIATYREEFERKIREKFPEVFIIGQLAPRLSSTTMISYPGIHGQAVQIELEAQDIFVTTSSACSDNDPTPSKILTNMNIPDSIGRGVIRISLGLDSTWDIYQKIFKALDYAYEKLSKVRY